MLINKRAISKLIEYNGPQNLETKMRQERYFFPKNNKIIIIGRNYKNFCYH